MNLPFVSCLDRATAKSSASQGERQPHVLELTARERLSMGAERLTFTPAETWKFVTCPKLPLSPFSKAPSSSVTRIPLAPTQYPTPKVKWQIKTNLSSAACNILSQGAHLHRGTPSERTLGQPAAWAMLVSSFLSALQRVPTHVIKTKCTTCADGSASSNSEPAGHAGHAHTAGPARKSSRRCSAAALSKINSLTHVGFLQH